MSVQGVSTDTLLKYSGSNRLHQQIMTLFGNGLNARLSLVSNNHLISWWTKKMKYNLDNQLIISVFYQGQDIFCPVSHNTIQSFLCLYPCKLSTFEFLPIFRQNKQSGDVVSLTIQPVTLYQKPSLVAAVYVCTRNDPIVLKEYHCRLTNTHECHTMFLQKCIVLKFN